MRAFVNLERLIIRIACALAALSFVTLFYAEQGYAAGKQVTIGTGGTTGVYYLVGGAICRLINKSADKNGLNCEDISTDGSVTNVNGVSDGKFDFGIVQSDVQNSAFKGTQRFQKPMTNLRALFSMYIEPFTIVARDDSKINSFEELAGKRIHPGEEGSGTLAVMELLMKEYDWTSKSFSLFANIKTDEMASALCDNKIDAFLYIVGHPNASITEASVKCNTHIVPVEGAKVDAFVKKYAHYPKTIIPGRTYKGSDKDVNTFGPRATIVANANVTDETAYQIVKAVFENFDEFRKQHPRLENLTKAEMLTGNSAPFHPGAIRYYKEAGLMR